MGETAFIKQQKKLQLQKQKETRRALLKAKSTPDKTTRRGKPVKKELSKEEKIKQLEVMKKKNEEKNKKLSTEEKKKKIKELEEQVKKKEEALKKKSDKKENLKSEKKPVVKKPAVKKAKGGDPINKLTGPEAEELVEKILPLLKPSEIMGWRGEIRVVYNQKERKQLIKDLMNNNLKKKITKEERKKFSPIYIPTPIGIDKSETGIERVSYVEYKASEGGYESYTLHPQLYTDSLFGREINKWDTKKARQIIEDYLKGDIGTKKKEVNKKLEVKDFTIIMKGKNYNKEEFLKWVDTKGYKFSKQQLEKLNFLVSERGLQSFRHYYNSNGVLVLVPTLKFNASTKVYNQETKKYEEISIGEVLSELQGERGGSVLKLELKPKVKIELTPEKIKEYDMTRLQFIKEELPSLKKTQKETEDKLEVYLKEYKKLQEKKTGPYGYSGSSGSLPFMKELQVSKAKDWLFNKQSIPQPIRDWYEKNVKDIQRLNLIVDNIYDTIKSYESKQKQLENKYN